MGRLIVISLAVVIGGSYALGSGHGQAASHAEPVRPHAARHVITMHYTATERLAINAMDVAAGKAMQASMSPTGVYEGRTTQDWCQAMTDVEYEVVKHHSLAWATRVDRASDEESRTFQGAAKACG